MKIEELTRPGLLALGLAGITATALLGFAAGVAVSRDPQAVHRTARRVARAAALGLERATLLAAQVRERAGDLWAEAREAAVADVDDADFKRATAAAASASPDETASATDEAKVATAKKPARKRATAAPRRPKAKPESTAASGKAAKVRE